MDGLQQPAFVVADAAAPEGPVCQDLQASNPGRSKCQQIASARKHGAIVRQHRASTFKYYAIAEHSTHMRVCSSGI